MTIYDRYVLRENSARTDDSPRHMEEQGPVERDITAGARTEEAGRALRKSTVMTQNPSESSRQHCSRRRNLVRGSKKKMVASDYAKRVIMRTMIVIIAYYAYQILQTAHREHCSRNLFSAVMFGSSDMCVYMDQFMRAIENSCGWIVRSASFWVLHAAYNAVYASASSVVYRSGATGKYKHLASSEKPKMRGLTAAKRTMNSNCSTEANAISTFRRRDDTALSHSFPTAEQQIHSHVAPRHLCCC